MKEYLASAVFIFLIVPLLSLRVEAKGPKATVKVGPNVRVGEEGTRQFEPYIAAHPEDSQSLIISTAEAVSGKGLIAQAYFTADGGRTWSGVPLPRMRQGMLERNLEFAGDDWVTYAPNGVVFFSALWVPPDEGSSIFVYRSSDKGLSWQGPVEIPAKSFDQPYMVATGEHGQVRLYIAAAAGGRDPLLFTKPISADVVSILRSDDGGLSFRMTGFITPDNLGHNAMNPLVLADGSLLVPFVDYPRDRSQSVYCARIYVVRSEDGGHTFSLPQFVADVPRAFPDGAHFAVDLSSSKFRGRIYAAYDAGDFGPHRVRKGNEMVRQESGNRRDVAIAYSADSGKTWSTSKALRMDGKGPAYYAALAISPAGLVGVTWIQHEKYETDPRCYGAYFTVSADGGETFTPPQTVSDAVSCPDKAKNRESAYAGRPRGGDYIGLAAAADGNFHAVWIDARDGAFRAYTARIQVTIK